VVDREEGAERRGIDPRNVCQQLGQPGMPDWLGQGHYLPTYLLVVLYIFLPTYDALTCIDTRFFAASSHVETAIVGNDPRTSCEIA